MVVRRSPFRLLWNPLVTAALGIGVCASSVVLTDGLDGAPSHPFLDPAGVDAARIRALHDAIATRHLWSSLGRADERWR